MDHAVPAIGWSIERAADSVGVTANAVKARLTRHQFSRAADGGLDPQRFGLEWEALRGARGGRPRTKTQPGARMPNSGAGRSKQTDLLDRVTEAKAIETIEKSRMAVIRRKRAEGRTCDVDEVSEWAGGLFVAARDLTLGLPAQVASEGAERLGCDAAALEAWLDEVIRAHMASLTSDALTQAGRFREKRKVGGRG